MQVGVAAGSPTDSAFLGLQVGCRAARVMHLVRRERGVGAAPAPAPALDRYLRVQADP